MKILIRLLAATVFFVLIAAAVITILDPVSETNTDGDTEVAAETTTRSVVRPAARTPDTPRNASSVAPRPAALPEADVLPAAPELEQALGNRLTTTTPIYQSSSSGATLRAPLGSLDQVETGVMVLNEDGLWLEIRLNREPYGFVRGADLSTN